MRVRSSAPENHPPRADPRDDRVLRFTRWLSAAVLPFLVVASVLLTFWPGATEAHFAWTIRPPLTALLLGSAYLGGILFFAQALRVRAWHRVAHGFPAVATFAALAGLATLLHLDRFHAGHPSFYAWALLYATTPFLVAAAWLRNRRTDPYAVSRPDLGSVGATGPRSDEVHVPLAVRLLLAGVGALPLLVGLTLFVHPPWLMDGWPWALTPLTARILGAIFSLPGVVALGLVAEPRWSAFRVPLQAQMLSLLLLLLAFLRARHDLDWTQPQALMMPLGLALYLLLYAALYGRFEARRRSRVRQHYA